MANPEPNDPTPGELYSASRAELIAFARSASAEQAAAMVPATPAWAVRDVVAHVVGINTDVLGQNLEGIGSDEWTALQVANRADRTLDEICDEWESLAPQIDQLGIDNPFMALRLNGDLVVHIHDIGGAVGREFDRASGGVVATMKRYALAFDERIDAAGLTPAQVVATDVGWSGDHADAVVTLSATAFELMRALSGRRSDAQVAAMNWSGDHEHHLALVSAYGAPAADLVE